MTIFVGHVKLYHLFGKTDPEKFVHNQKWGLLSYKRLRTADLEVTKKKKEDLIKF